MSRSKDFNCVSNRFVVVFKVTTGGCAVLKDKDRFIYYLVTKPVTAAGVKPTYETLEGSLTAMRNHMVTNGVKDLAIPQIGCGLDGLQWDQVDARIRSVFGETDIEITVYKYVPPN